MTHNPKTYTMRFNFLSAVIVFLFMNVAQAQQQEKSNDHKETETIYSAQQIKTKSAVIDYEQIDLILERIKKQGNKRNIRRGKNTVFKIIDTVYVEIKYKKSESKLTDF